MTLRPFRLLELASIACCQASLKPALVRGDEVFRSPRSNLSLRGPGGTEAEHRPSRFAQLRRLDMEIVPDFQSTP